MRRSVTPRRTDSRRTGATPIAGRSRTGNGSRYRRMRRDDCAAMTTKRHLITLLYGQFSGATRLREIVTGLESHETRLYHLGAAPVKRSTISDANSNRPWQVFSELATMLMQETNDRGDNSHEGDRGDGPGCG